MEFSVRWMRRDDMRRVLSIRRGSELDPGLLEAMLGDSFVICKVAELEGRVVGFVAYKNRRRIKLLEVAVHPSFRRRGVALCMLRSVLSKNTKMVCATVSEYNLPAHMLLKKSGFRAVKSLRSSSGSDYKFVIEAKSDCQNTDSSLELPKVAEN